MATLINKGRLINFVTGITGVASGGQAIINLPVNQRYHKIVLQSTAINFTGGAALTATALTGSGTALQVDVTVNGSFQVATIAPTSGHAGSGFVTGDTITFTDPTGAGFVGTVTASAGAVTAIAITTNGTPTNISPTKFYSSVKLIVNGVNMRDIEPESIMRLAWANGQKPLKGQLPIFFTAPWRNCNSPNDVCSWDMFGQSTFALQLGINSNIVTPGVSGIQEFDYQRNVMPSADGKTLVPFLQPVAQHEFSFNLVAGRNDINTLPFSYPISRLWFVPATAGTITQVEIYQDQNKVFEGTLQQLRQTYENNGFQFGQSNWLNNTWATSAALQKEYEKPDYYDSAFISDPDQRWSKALRVANSLIVRIYSSAAQSCSVMMETLPGAYTS